MKQILGDLIPSDHLADKVDAFLDFSQLWAEQPLNYSHTRPTLDQSRFDAAHADCRLRLCHSFRTPALPGTAGQYYKSLVPSPIDQEHDPRSLGVLTRPPRPLSWIRSIALSQSSNA